MAHYLDKDGLLRFFQGLKNVFAAKNHSHTTVNGHSVNADVPSGAKFTDTVYTHPSYTSKSSGLYKVTVDSTGHVSGTTAVAKSDITALGIPAQDTTYSAASQSAAGLMSAADKKKLDGIAAGAQVNTVTGVKGNSESSYRTGNVNLTAANIGAVATSGNETVAGNKTFSGTTTLTNTSVTSIAQNGSIPANVPTSILASPISGFLWHDLFAFSHRGEPTYYTTTNGTTWIEATLQKAHFMQKEDMAFPVLTSSIIGARWVWYSTRFAWANATWLVISSTYTSPKANSTVLFESSTDGTTWTTLYTGTPLGPTTPIWCYLSGYTNPYYLRLTITKAASDTGTQNIGAIRLLSYRWGDQGGGSEYEFPYDWDSNCNIQPRNNGSFKGNGSGLTSLNGSNISSGTVAAARLPAASTSAQGAMSAADKTKLDGLSKALWVDFGTISSLPVTKTFSGVLTDMVVARMELGTPSAQRSDWTVNTDTANSVTISGTVSGSTTCKILLVTATSGTAS